MKVISSLFAKTMLAFAVVFFWSLTKAQTSDILDAHLAKTFEAYNLKGISVSARFSDGSTWSQAMGNHGSEGALSSDMLFEMGSITKSMTTAIIMQLVEEGELSLQDSIYRFLDSYENIDSNITIRQLLNHTSGVYSYEDNNSLVIAVLLFPEEIWEPEEVLEFVEAPYFEPGKGWAYSNSNYLLLGLIIEAIEGRDFHESLRKRIFEPLGMENSYLEPLETPSETRALSWSASGEYQEAPSNALLSAAWAAGALVSTTKDVALWAESLYSGSFLGEEATAIVVEKTEAEGQIYNYGLGTSLSTYNEFEVLGHFGNTVLQHANMSYCPELNVTLALAINQEGADDVIETVRDELLALVISEERGWGQSLEGYQGTRVKIFPNPATEYFNLPDDLENSQVQILSSTGQLLFEQRVSGKQRMDVSQLQPGTYIVRLFDRNQGLVSHQTLVVQ